MGFRETKPSAHYEYVFQQLTSLQGALDKASHGKQGQDRVKFNPPPDEMAGVIRIAMVGVAVPDMLIPIYYLVGRARLV